MDGERPYKVDGREGGRERRGGEGGRRGRAVKGRGDERGKGGKWGQRPDEDERPFGSSERVIPFPATTAYLYPELSQAHPQTFAHFHSQTS